MTSDIRKLFLTAGGVGFAVVLMFMQIGFRNALFDNTVQLAKLLRADLFVVSRARYNLPSEQRFDRVVLDQIRSVDGIAAILPVYIERSITELRVLGRPSRSIRVVGVPIEGNVFQAEAHNQQRLALRDGRSALLDRRTKRPYGFERSRLEVLRSQEVELSGRAIRMVDWVDIGTDFVHDGTLVVSDRAVVHYFPFRNGTNDPLGIVDLGLVQLETGADLQQSKRMIQERSNGEWEVLTKSEIIQREIRFWGTATPIGIIFTVGTVMGLVVGTIICYQILFTEVTDHMAEFATLKAMGYGSGYFFWLVLYQSLYLTLLGFAPGLLAAYGFYRLLAQSTGLVMLLTPYRIGLVLGLTLFMCIVSGLLAVRKLWSADPANLF